MASDRARSLQDIRRDTERTREGLTSTVSQLQTAVSETASDVREKLRPQAITSEVSGYIKSRGEELVQNLTEAARRNPMQAVAVGASVAYPLMRIARSIPLPVLMMGAGLFFAGSKKGRDLTQQASNAAGDFADEVRRRTHDLSDQMTQAASDAKDYAMEAAGRMSGTASDAVEESRRAATGAMDAIQDQVGSTAQRAQDVAGSAGASIRSRADDARSATAAMTDNLKTQASQAAGSVSETVISAVQAGQEYSTAARERLVEAASRAGQTMQETIEQNPLLVAGVGLLIGGLVASALPSFDLEDDLMGDASDKFRRRAYEATNETLDSAKRTADEILATLAQQAEAEGLTPDGLANGMQEVGQRLQRVAERGITTAFEPEGTNDLQSHSRGTENG